MESDAEEAGLASYRQSVREYEAYVASLRQIPSHADQAMILQNLLNYLQDPRFYSKFYRRYSRYWVPSARRTIEPYRGLWIPVEKPSAADTLTATTDVAQFEPLRRAITQYFYDCVRLGETPDLTLDERLVSVTPLMSPAELDVVLFPQLRVVSPDAVPQHPFPYPAVHEPDDTQRQLAAATAALLSPVSFIAPWLTRAHLIASADRALVLHADPSRGRWLALSATETLRAVLVMLCALGNAAPRPVAGQTQDPTQPPPLEFPQPHHLMYWTSQAGPLRPSRAPSAADLLALWCCLLVQVPVALPAVLDVDPGGVAVRRPAGASEPRDAPAWHDMRRLRGYGRLAVAVVSDADVAAVLARSPSVASAPLHLVRFTGSEAPQLPLTASGAMRVLGRYACVNV
jgi:hypothetical protein